MAFTNAKLIKKQPFKQILKYILSFAAIFTFIFCMSLANVANRQYHIQEAGDGFIESNIWRQRYLEELEEYGSTEKDYDYGKRFPSSLVISHTRRRS